LASQPPASRPHGARDPRQGAEVTAPTPASSLVESGAGFSFIPKTR
jgi:hypothetical protein